MEKTIKFILNNETIELTGNPALPLLDYIRKEKHLHGTKEVCKEGDCGACTVLLGELINGELKYKTITSCIYPIGNVNGKHVVTIEGINSHDLTPQQKAFADEGASQCGFCTPGFIMSLTGYLLNNKDYNFEEAVNALGGNICRCTGYESIKRAVKNLIDEFENIEKNNRQEFLADQKIFQFESEKIIPRLQNQLFNGRKINYDNVTFVGGGSDLFVQRADDLLEREIINLNEMELKFIDEKDNFIFIGGGTSFEDVKQSEIMKKYFPSLPEKIDLIASLPIRNSATIAGNISNASPIGDFTIIMLALKAEIILFDGSSRRSIPLKEFYNGYKSLNKLENEIIELIKFPVPHGEPYFNFEKVSKRTYLDIASVNSAIFIEVYEDKIKEINISAGGVSPVPMRLLETEKFMQNKELTEQTIREAISIIEKEISPISDVRGSKEYKALLLSQLFKAHFIELFPEQINIGELI